MKVIRLDVDVLGEYKNLFSTLYDVFGDNTVVLYGVVNDNGLIDVICRSGYKVIYIQNGKSVNISNYMIDDNYEIDMFAYNGVEYALTDRFVSSIRDGKIEESLVQVNDLDEDNPYAGHVIYSQYNPETDVEANLKYYHRCDLNDPDKRSRIYDFNIRDIDFLSIDEQARKKPFEWGFMGRKHQYFGKMEFDADSYDYDILAIKEFGLREYIHQGSASLLRDYKVTRYSKGFYLSRSGTFRCTWPIGYAYKQEELKEILSRYSFSTEIPKDLLDVYNGDHFMLRRVGRILSEIKEIEKDEKKIVDIATLLKMQP